MTDSVNHPQHYKMSNGVEVIDLTEQLNFNRGNAVKYLARAGKKEGTLEIEDLRKARWYVDREIQRLEKADDAAQRREMARAEIKVWDGDGALVATYLVEDIESMCHEVNRERIGYFDGCVSVPSSVIESIVFRFEFPLGMTTRYHQKETP